MTHNQRPAELDYDAIATNAAYEAHEIDPSERWGVYWLKGIGIVYFNNHPFAGDLDRADGGRRGVMLDLLETSFMEVGNHVAGRGEWGFEPGCKRGRSFAFVLSGFDFELDVAIEIAGAAFAAAVSVGGDA